jgi:hypothetical protein
VTVDGLLSLSFSHAISPTKHRGLGPVCILQVPHNVHAIKIFRNSLHFPPSLVSHMEQRIS